ncbi:MAG: hypothetical protein DRI01_08395 [Chloroflexi bacterium]|nr:MAG: hypothetical protein DRI01_08395 [Chloroflexota bacterium]
MVNEMREGFVQKRCPKCGGNIYLDRDYHGWYEKCLQCGYTCDLGSIVDVREKVGKNNLGQAGGGARAR